MAESKGTLKTLLSSAYKDRLILNHYMARLDTLYGEISYTANDLVLALENAKTIKTERCVVQYVFYTGKSVPVNVHDTNTTFNFHIPGGELTKEIMVEFQEMHSNMDCIIFTPCELTVRIYNKMPKGMSRVNKVASELGIIHNVSSPNWDKVGTQYAELIQKTLVSNTSLVYKTSIEKLYSIIPRIEVIIDFMTLYDCSYNKRTIERKKGFKENDQVLNNITAIM